MNIIIEQIISILVSSGFLFTIFKKWSSKIEDSEEGKKALKIGVQSLLKDRLYQLYAHCSEKGYVTLKEKENFESMYNSYHNLHSNGVMDSVYKDFMELPIDIE